MLFPTTPRELSDEEIATLLKEAMRSTATGLPRHVDTFLAAQSASWLVDKLRLAGVVFSIAEVPPRRLKP